VHAGAATALAALHRHRAVIHAVRGVLHRHVHLHLTHHIAHSQARTRIEWRDLGAHPRPWRERAARVARAIHRLREDRIGAVVRRRDEHIADFGRTKAKLVDANWLDILTVDRNDAELQARNAHI